jgi:hypothetical protein
MLQVKKLQSLEMSVTISGQQGVNIPQDVEHHDQY